ncbi:winged helix-turn-helix domain-containing protein [Streptomyces sp. WG-D5]
MDDKAAKSFVLLHHYSGTFPSARFRLGLYCVDADVRQLCSARLIFKLYGVRFAESGAGKYLKRWRLIFQWPDKRAAEHGSGSCPSMARGDLAGIPGPGEGR